MPRIRVRDAGGTLRTITRIRLRDATGTLRTISRIRGRDTSGTLRTFFDSLSVTVSPSTADGYVAGASTQNVDTGSVLATATGGTTPYSYAWTQVGTSPYTWTISSPAAASTYFTAQSLPVGVAATNTFRVTVTDASSFIAAWDVFATARNNNSLPGGGSGEPYEEDGSGGGPGSVFNPPGGIHPE